MVCALVHSNVTLWLVTVPTEEEHNLPLEETQLAQQLEEPQVPEQELVLVVVVEPLM